MRPPGGAARRRPDPGLPGGVDQYLALRTEALSASAGRSGDAVPSRPADADQGRAAGASANGADARQARKETARIEEGETRLHARMAEQAADHAAVLALDEELRALVAERDELEAAELAEP